jgi:two-component system NtrC family sensor kinase
MGPSPKKTNKDLPQHFALIAGLAQDLDAPLHSITARTQALIDQYKNKDFEYISYKDFKSILGTLEQVNRQLKNCSAITGRMLNLNKRRANISHTRCQVNEIVEEILALVGQQLDASKVKIKLRLAENLPLIDLGPVECHQVINNVLINAVQSMPGGGKIKITTKLEGQKFVAVDVFDEGVGITPEHLSKVFEPFFTTKEWGVEKNSGLGLSIVYSIIKAAGGTIDIESSLRKGTHVRMLLPVASS